MTIPVILDTDIGTDIDDTWALAMLLRRRELDLRLVVTATGDTTYRARLVAGLLETAGRSEVPIGVGISTELPESIVARPQERFADLFSLSEHPGGVREDGVAALIDAIMTSTEPITVIGIGPMTNIAAALRREPKIAERARLVAMLGSLNQGYGPHDEPVAEYNVAADVNACRETLAAPWSTTITPLDSCGSVMLRGSRYAAVKASSDPLARAVVRNYEIWVEAVTERDPDWEAGAERHAASFDGADATNESDAEAFRNRSSTILFDAVAVYLAYDETFLDIEELSVALDERGVMHVEPGVPTLRVATAWRNRGAFLDHLVETLVGAEGSTTGPV